MALPTGRVRTYTVCDDPPQEALTLEALQQLSAQFQQQTGALPQMLGQAVTPEENRRTHQLAARGQSAQGGFFGSPHRQAAHAAGLFGALGGGLLAGNGLSPDEAFGVFRRHDWRGLDSGILTSLRDPKERENALALLKKVIGASAFEAFEEHGGVAIKTKTSTYLFREQQSTVRLIEEDTRTGLFRKPLPKGLGLSYCYQIPAGLHPIDKVIAEILMIQTDERAYLNTAQIMAHDMGVDAKERIRDRIRRLEDYENDRSRRNEEAVSH